MANILKIFLFISIALAVVGNYETSASCVAVTTMANLNFSKFASGTWYAIKGGRDLFFGTGHCAKIAYSTSSMNITVDRFPSFKFPYTVNNNVMTFSKTVSQIYLNVSMNTYVLDTDYDNYAVLYGCGEFASTMLGIKTAVGIPLVLSRQSTLDSSFSAKVDTALSNNKLKSSSLNTAFKACSN
ncbi:hypothetical protein PVAND_005410 [Polypedilum vanderplanki]|uniref:Lipocalin n=1 Tax=Polypedilum vanderplanki TaxID=319348 RepID=A0A9J6C0I2_POLVA|nr:hypothetical protein PVAND_005410 [Polypedilum vanderplanki]